MRLIIESTDEVTTIDGVPVRVWRGRTESGRPVDVFVHRIRSGNPATDHELERELCKMQPPIELDLAEIEARRFRERTAEN